MVIPAKARSQIKRFLVGLFLLLLGSVVQGAGIKADGLIEEVVVEAHPLSEGGVAQPTASLFGTALERAQEGTLGDTLRNIAGVNSASFGPAVGRPVIRGLGGARVKIMQDRVDSLDVSVSSPDHGAMVDPFIAQGVEVLKGPASLIYGTGAIGGVVNVVTARIPSEVPEQLEGKVEVRGSDNADRRSASGRIDGGSGNFAFHLDGAYRDADEYDIPGFAESAAQRALEEAEGEEGEEEEEEEAFGVLPGSQAESQEGAIGLSYVGERGFLGFSVSTRDAKYGLPGHSHHHHHEEEEHDEEGHDEEDHDEEGHDEEEEAPPVLDLEMTRFDLEGELLDPVRGFERLNFRFGYNDYEHTEVEEEGGGTTFSSEAWESRLELSYESFLGFQGVVGAQLGNREFSALGEEAFVSPVDSEDYAIFWAGERGLGSGTFEAGLRFDRVEHDPSVGSSRDYSLGSLSLGLIQPLSSAWTLNLQLDRVSRAPVAEELFSNGPHLATQSFEIGDPSLDEETSTNVSVGLEYQGDKLFLSLSAFNTSFSDYIYLQDAGREEDELRVLNYAQDDATFRGLELEANWQVADWTGGTANLLAGFDMVDAELDQGGGTDLPRIPAARWKVGGQASWNNFFAEILFQRTDRQGDVGVGDLPVSGFDDLGVSLSYAVELGNTEAEVFFSGRNLTDDEQRLNTSFISQFAPQPGRTMELGLRVRF